jgi:ferritin
VALSTAARTLRIKQLLRLLNTRLVHYVKKRGSDCRITAVCDIPRNYMVNDCIEEGLHSYEKVYISIYTRVSADWTKMSSSYST